MTLAADVSAKRPRSADLAGAGKRAFSWRRFAKFVFGAVMLAAAVLTFYQQLIVRVSRDAVINARLAVIRAPIDGVATASVTTPGSAMKAGEAVGRVEDLLADDARLAQLQREVSATALERDSLTRQLSDLERARGEAEAQADAYRVGRVRQLELRIDEARANRAARSRCQSGRRAGRGTSCPRLSIRRSPG